MKGKVISFLACLLASSQLVAAPSPVTSQMVESPIALAIHGGAGTISKAKLSEAQKLAYKAKLQEALDAGYVVLEQGGDSLQAVKSAINILENSPLFNAGLGAVYTFDGTHELDASIMDGKTMNAGAVAGVSHISNPIDLAIEVMKNSPHVMLSGAGAEEFALNQGFSLVPAKYFDTDKRHNSLLDAKEKLRNAEKATKDFQAAVGQLDLDYKFGTVGAVALDRHGNLAAGTSTGGMTAKRFGRIGDSPVIGAGTYAENGVCAVSATGHGEYFIRYHVAGDICARIKYQQKPLSQAADEVINRRLVEAGGSGGVISLDASGNIAMPFNTEGMYRASKSSSQKMEVSIW